MRFYKNKPFQRDSKNSEITDEDLNTVIDDIFDGRSIPLGARLYKIRGATEGKGKSGGFRSIFYWKKDRHIIFCVLFTKNEQENITQDEKKVLKILSKEYDNLTDEEIERRVHRSDFTEINYEKQK